MILGAGRSAALRIPRSTSIQTRSIFTSKKTGPPPSQFRRAAGATLLVLTTGVFAVYYLDSRSAIHRYVLTPLLRYGLDAESGHKVAVKVLRSGLAPRDMGVDDERLAVQLWNDTISNPIGLAAGFDKDGEAIDGLFDLGFGWVEIGSVTPKPQPGNPKPRVFHLPSDAALINRYGFPSQGHVALLSRLRARLPTFTASSSSEEDAPPEHASLRPKALLAINLGKNKSSPPESIADFVTGVRVFGPYADVLVVNVSSPNTPGLRGLQNRGMLEELLPALLAERDALPLQRPASHPHQPPVPIRKPKLILKIAPDLDEAALRDIAEVVAQSGVDGVIVSNTTVQRPGHLIDESKSETGGLSGPPLRPLSLRALRTLRTHLPASIPLIGCGGISSGADALEYARAGASAVQVYTAFGYDGVGACRRIKDEVREALEREGTTWGEVVKRAVEELSAKAPAPQEKTTQSKEEKVKPGEGSVQQLIEEAEELKRMLDQFGEGLEGKVALQ